MASTASSIFNWTRRLDQKMYTHPATIPITNAAHGSQTEHPAVIPTNPEREPFMHIVISYVVSPVCLRVMIISVNMAETDPAAAARVVVTAHRAETSA